MPFIPYQGGVRVVARGTFDGVEMWQNTFGFRNPDGSEWLEADDGNVLPTLRNAYASRVASLTTRWKLDTISFTPVHAPGQATRTYPATVGGTALVGTDPDPALPPQVAIVVTWKSQPSAVAARYGRIYTNGYTTSDVATNGRINESVKDAVGNVWAGLRSNVLPNAELVIFSRRNVSPVTGFGAQLPVTQVGVGSLFDTQRRRAEALPDPIEYYV